MEKHVADSCPRCGEIFTCKVNNVLQCDCMKLVLTKAETEYIADITEWEYEGSCLCNKCVLELKKEFSILDIPFGNNVIPLTSSIENQTSNITPLLDNA